MDTEMQSFETGKNSRKRKLGKKKGGVGKKRMKVHENTGPPKIRNSLKMKKLFKKRAKEYNSDDEDSGPESEEPAYVQPGSLEDASASEDEGLNDLEMEEEMGGSDDKGDEIQEGTKFVEGVRAFKVAFMKIMSIKVPDDAVSPILSGRRKLIAEKLAEEDAEHKVKGEAKKEKHLAKEKGHVKPASFLDTKEKFLISVATKGVVKLFNAVSKAQNAQKGLNPSRSKDAKALDKKRKETFFSELRKPLQQSTDDVFVKSSTGNTSTRHESKNEHGWAPLHDGYMLTDSKLKDWDKMPDPTATVVPDEMLVETSSDDE